MIEDIYYDDWLLQRKHARISDSKLPKLISSYIYSHKKDRTYHKLNICKLNKYSMYELDHLIQAYDQTDRFKIDDRLALLLRIEAVAIGIYQQINLPLDMKRKIEDLIHLISKRKIYLYDLSEYYENIKNTGKEKNKFTDVLDKFRKTSKFTSTVILGIDEKNMMESIDPLHRYFFYLNVSFKDWINETNSKIKLPFLVWLEVNAKKYRNTSEKTIRYLSYEERKKLYLLRVHQESNSIVLKRSFDIKNFDTKNFNGPYKGFAAFVISQIGEIFAGEHVLQSIHHTTLSGGKEIFGAGMMSVNDGKIVQINDKSGHYKPYLLNFVRVVHYLNQLNILSENCNISLTQENKVWGSVNSFLEDISKREKVFSELKVVNFQERIQNSAASIIQRAWKNYKNKSI